MTPSRASRWLVSCLLSGLLLVGCGGGGSSSSSGSTANAEGGVTKARFTRDAEAICERVATKLSSSLSVAAEKMVSNGKGLTRADEEQLLVTITAPMISTMARELGELEAPAAAQGEKFEAMIEEFAAAAKKTEEDPAAALKESPVTAPAAKAVAVGLTSCSEI